MRVHIAIAVLLAAGACAPAIPDSNPAPRGVGFDDYNSYRAQQNAELSGQAATAAPPAATAAAPTEAEQLAADTRAALGTGGEQTADAAPVVDLNNPRISDEQSFEAVSSRETIESDAERLRAQREAYRVVEPTAVPTRPTDTGPNIVAYALQAQNQPGQQVYRRTNLLSDGTDKARRACARYPSPDLAQQDFLSNGGPERDRLGLDPDGDGFACGWDPRPFRAASR